MLWKRWWSCPKKSANEWFLAKTEASDRSELFDALWNGDTERLKNFINDTLFDTISYHGYKESFYHAFLAGLLSQKGFQVESNYENSLGRSDIVVKDRKNRRAAVIETKITDSEHKLAQACENALEQISQKQYAAAVKKSGYQQVASFGIAFYQKQCWMKGAWMIPKSVCLRVSINSRACLKIAFRKMPSQFTSAFMLDLGGVV